MRKSILHRVPLLRRLPPRVAVLRLSGPIGEGGVRGGLTLAGVAEPLHRAFTMSRLRAVAISVNSPGGAPAQAGLIAQRIRDLAEEHDVRVLTFCEDAAASGGYWLACAGDEIHAHAGSLVGAIGVVSAGFGVPELLRRHGIERRVHATGSRKAMLDPFREEDPADVAHLRAMQDDILETFAQHVRERRGAALTAADEELFSGAVWTGRQAARMGLVDGLGEPRATLRGIYGPRVRLREVPTQRKLFGRIPLVGGPAGLQGGGTTWTGDLLAAAEERALWQRLGL
mgnify:CR=1 FL=1